MFQKLIKKHSDKIRFAIVGGTNTAIDFGILFALFNLAKLPIFYSNIISTSVALTFSFFANKKFTFKDNTARARAQLAKFLVITLFGLWVMQPIIIALSNSMFYYANINSSVMLLIGKLLASCFTLVWNYLMYKKFVFTSRQKKETENNS